MNTPVIFTIQPHSIIDVITNSSTELFVGKSQSSDEIKDLIRTVYPNYLDEYFNLNNIDEITDEDFDTYLSFKYYNPRNDLILSETFNIAPETLYSNYTSIDEEFWYPELSPKGIQMIKDQLDPNKEMYFLFSKDDNPNWEMQEKLMEFMNRYHLG